MQEYTCKNTKNIHILFELLRNTFAFSKIDPSASESCHTLFHS